jgi:hypothetical protein
MTPLGSPAVPPPPRVEDAGEVASTASSVVHRGGRFRELLVVHHALEPARRHADHGLKARNCFTQGWNHPGVLLVDEQDA